VFTDSYVTPRRLETLVDVLRHMGSNTTRDSLYRVLQPEQVRDTDKPQVATAVLSAAHELELVEGTDRLNILKSPLPTRDLVLEALDSHVLARTDIEPYFALFFSYLLARGDDGPLDRSGSVDDFNQRVPRHPTHPIAFNPTMHTGLRRWLRYAGLGWSDPKGVFQCCPYERLLRTLPAIFDDAVRLSSETFMERMAAVCPELDGGAIFAQANSDFDASGKVLTQGVANALLDLHADAVLRLHATADSGGWSLERAEPSSDAKTLLAPRLDAIELIATTRSTKTES